MRPSRVPTTSLRLNKSSDHKAEQQRAKLGYINDKWQPCAALVEPWGMTNNDTLIKLDEANGQCVVACSSLSVSWKLWTCPAISRVKHIGQHPFLFWQRRPAVHSRNINRDWFPWGKPQVMREGMRKPLSRMNHHYRLYRPALFTLHLIVAYQRTKPSLLPQMFL